MTWGIPSHLFLEIHIALSLIGIVSGLLVLYGLLNGISYPGWTALFLAHNFDQHHRISDTAVWLRSAARCRHALARAARHRRLRVLMPSISPEHGAGSMS